MTRKEKRIIPITAIDRIFAEIKDGFIDFEPQFELGKILESIALEILEIANKMSAHAKRKTMKDKDIQIAFEHWKRKTLKDDDGEETG